MARYQITKRDLIEEGNEVVLVGRYRLFLDKQISNNSGGYTSSGDGALLAMLNKRREKLAGGYI